MTRASEKMRTLLLLGLVAALGCGGNEDANARGNGGAQGEGGAGGIAAGGAGGTGGEAGSPGVTVHTIVIDDWEFTPSVTAVRPGDRLSIKNRDDFDHTFTSMAVPGTYEYGEVNGFGFDVEIQRFTGEATIEIPEDLALGTEVHYFSRPFGDQAGTGMLVVE